MGRGRKARGRDALVTGAGGVLQVSNADRPLAARKNSLNFIAHIARVRGVAWGEGQLQ